MTEPLTLLGINPFVQSEPQSPQVQKTLLQFPLQNLALDSQLEQSLTKATSASQGKISLTPQALASIITNAVVSTAQSMLSVIIEKLLPLFAQNPVRTVESTGTSAPSQSGATEESSEASASEETEATESGTATNSSTDAPEKSSGFDTVKNIFKSVTDFLFGEKAGVGGILKDILTTVLPGGTAIKILSKFKTIGKAFSSLLTLGNGGLGKLVTKGAKFLDSIFPGSSEAVKGLFDKGKSLLKKIF